MIMKLQNLILILLLVTITMSAQTKEELEIQDYFWGTNDTHKNKTDIPSKWQNESAVVIYKNVNHDYHKFGKKVTYKYSVRKRIKLLDKAAVKEFSEFSFEKRFRSSKGSYWRKKGESVFGLKIIKSDGKEIIVDVDTEAVEVDEKTKIAVANLEVGDIIDYYLHKTDPFVSKFQFGFDPVETTLSEEYPIMDYKLFFETENDFFINFSSFNGAPELKEIPTEKNNFRQYELVASNIEKVKPIIWFYPLVGKPAYKFQVYFARSGKFEDRALAFLPEKETNIKTSVSDEEVLELYDNRFKPDGNIGDLKGFLKNKVFNNDAEKVSAAYYYMRHYYLTRFIQAFYASEAKIFSPFYLYGNNPVFIQDEKQFVKHFTAFLKRQKIGYEFVIAKKRYDGSIDDLLIEKNVNVILKVLTQKPIYLEFFGPHTSVNQFTPYIEGTDVYLLTTSKNKIDGIKKGTLPVSSHLDNESKKDITVSIDTDFSTLDFSVNNHFKGHQKTNEQQNRLLFDEYVREDYNKYGTKSLTEKIKNKKTKIKINKEMKALVEKIKKKQKESFEQTAKDEFNLTEIEDYTYKVIESGRYGLDSYLSYNETYKAKDIFLKKAGPNYIFEIGKLIGGQIELEDEERIRTENVNMNYPRSFNYNITLNIPEGYTVVGLDKLKKSVENTSGSFISTAKIDGNKLIVKTSKHYKHNFYKVSDWPKILAFLDEAHQFTTEKVLLKKK